MNVITKVIHAVALTSAVVALAACGSDSSSDSEESGPIIVGAAIAKTGFMTVVDEAPLKATQMTIDEINEAGGVNGRQLELISVDTASDRAKGKAAAEKVIADGAEILIVSCDYDGGLPAASVGVANDLLTISLCAGSLKFGVQGVGPTAFTPAVSALSEGAVGSEFALSRGWNTAFQLLDTTISYNEETCQGFADNYQAAGGEIVGTAEFQNADTSIASQIASIKAADPKVIQICTYTPGAATVLRQIRAAGITQPIVGTATEDGTYWTKSVPNLSDFYIPVSISIWGDDPDPEVNDFVKRYTDRFGEPATGYPVFGVAVAQMIEDGIEATDGSTDGETLTKALEEWRDHPLLPGPTTFTPERHITMARPMRIIEYKDGKPRYLETVELENPPAFSLR